MSPHRSVLPLALSILLLASSCVTSTKRLRSSALDYLYPQGATAAPPADVRLALPLRVGVAFAPDTSYSRESFTESQKQALLTRIARAFEGREGIQSVEVIPSSHLSPQGGFDNVHRLATAFGIDLIALISYDQIQFRDPGSSSWAYLTVVGAYFVKGEKNEIRTVLDAVVYDIPSRAMLFHATGMSRGKGSATPIDATRAMRKLSEQDFDDATDSLIANLGVALAEFQEQARTGTVRGPGTPAIALVDSAGKLVPAPGEKGAGALGVPELAIIALLLTAAGGHRRRR